MLKFLRTLVPGSRGAGTDRTAGPEPAPATIPAQGTRTAFDLLAHLHRPDGLALLDWRAAHRWLAGCPGEAARGQAWAALQRAWLLHLRDALGPAYSLRQDGNALVLSALDARTAAATLAFVNRTRQRILHVLQGLARVPEGGHDILVVFDDPDTYYRYAAQYDPSAGEFALSSGMYIDAGCGHFATVAADLRAIEPVIAHELTHAFLGHLSLPAWLNEGIAVNTEQRLCPPPGDPFGLRDGPQQMHARHRSFWGRAEIQQFWSGQSFLRADEGNELSYDLARILAAQFAGDWERFQPFVLAASVHDAGAAAAAEHLGVDLGAAVAALLEQPASPQWAPQPAAWPGQPERGAF